MWSRFSNQRMETNLPLSSVRDWPMVSKRARKIQLTIHSFIWKENTPFWGEKHLRILDHFCGWLKLIKKEKARVCEEQARIQSSESDHGHDWGAPIYRSTQRRFPPKYNTLKTLFRLSGVLLDQKRYILFANYKGLSIIFPKNFRWNWMFYESETFSDSSRHLLYESENFTCPFFTKNSLT